MDKLILTDVDGVLLYWNAGFDKYMKKLGYEKKVQGEYELSVSYDISEDKAHELAIAFNKGPMVGTLGPLRDAAKYVKKLHDDHGYRFHCVTAIPNNPRTWLLRNQNLKNLFGNAICNLDCTDTSENKRGILEQYGNTGLPWIEDRPEMIELGLELGLSPYLLDHDYNSYYENNDVPRVKNWSEIYEMLT